MILKELGISAGRAVVLHVDDLGASHGANQAFLELFRRGLVTCGSVMVPGPWFREIAEAAQAEPLLDVGVHLTLTSEWNSCRWAPISTVSQSSGLIDDDGYFWRDLGSLQRNLVPAAAELELRSQIERAIAAGIRPTHIDAHMAGAMLPELLDAHVRLARDYALFPVLPRSIDWAPNLASYKDCLTALSALGAPVIDHCRGTLPIDTADLEDAWAGVLASLPPGLTHLALHCTTSGDFAAVAPDHARWRSSEYDFLANGVMHAQLEALGIASVATRGLQALWQRWEREGSGTGSLVGMP